MPPDIRLLALDIDGTLVNSRDELTEPTCRALARAREAARRSSCQNNLKQMGIVFKMYAGENRDTFPAMKVSLNQSLVMTGKW